MESRIRKSFTILNPGASLQRRVAYSLAAVRLILVPVLFLAGYYLFEMGWIVDRIVSVDAPAATLAQQASIEMLEARRNERNYLLLHDQGYLQGNAESLTAMTQTLGQIERLEPSESATIQKARDAISLYRRQLAAAVSAMGQPGQQPAERIEAAVRAYEEDLDALLKGARHGTRAHLVDELRDRVGSFDSEVTKTIQEGNPTIRRATADLQTSSQGILQIMSALESQNWRKVQNDHENAHQLLYRAERVLGVVSSLTLLLSVWISFVLPRQVVKPLVTLRKAIDEAAVGNHEIDFDIRGDGEVAQLATSIREFMARILRN
jgi:CHASE3 domain sensor protein